MKKDYAVLNNSDSAFYLDMQKKLETFARQSGIGAVPSLYQELTMANSSAEFHRDLSLARDHIALHSHTFYEIILVVRGNVQYLLDDRRYALQKGDLILIVPGISHCPLFPEHMTEPYERYVLWISDNLCRELSARQKDFDYCFHYCIHTQNYVLRVSSAFWEPILAVFRSGFREKTEGRFLGDFGQQICAQSILLQLDRLCLRLSGSQETPVQNELLDEILTYISEHIQEKITLSHTAESFFVSQSTITQLFQKHLGTSFYQYLLQKRLLIAKERLLSGEAAARIWPDCGFGDYSTFFRAFKKAFGVSPREYKKALGR